MMLFEIKISLLFSFSLRNNATSERQQSVGNQDQDLITLPFVSQKTVEPGWMINQPLMARAPVRPVLSRSTRYFRAESATRSDQKPRTNDTHIADTHSTKASDRESLEVLLRSSEQGEQLARGKASITDTAAELSNSSPSPHRITMSLDTLPEGPLVVRQSPGLEDDSGSDLVSSLQRIRIGGLASYFEELEKRARAPTEASTTARVVPGHGQSSATGLDEDQRGKVYDVADGKWNVITVREASDEG